MKNIISGILIGITLTLAVTSFYLTCSSVEPNASYEFQDDKSRKQFTAYLEKNNIKYSYTINQFKRHYIKPILGTEEEYKELSKIYFNHEYIKK
jgi:hypothetical protein